MTIAGEDLLSARSLPDEYARLTTRSGRRLLELVSRRWGDRQEGELRQLAQVLMTIFAPLDGARSEVTDDLRDTCEQVVATWIRTTVPGPAASASPSGRARVAEPGRRMVRLLTAHLATEEDGGSWAAVTLERNGTGRHAARIRCRPDTPTDQIRAGAEAAIEALRQVTPTSDLAIDLRETATFQALDRTGVIVSLTLARGDRRSTALGMCPDMAGEPIRAAAVAVLNATNRRLGLG